MKKDNWDRSFWIAFGNRWYPAIYIHTPWWHMALKRRRDALFSERNGYRWTKTIGPLLISLVTPRTYK